MRHSVNYGSDSTPGSFKRFRPEIQLDCSQLSEISIKSFISPSNLSGSEWMGSEFWNKSPRVSLTSCRSEQEKLVARLIHQKQQLQSELHETKLNAKKIEMELGFLMELLKISNEETEVLHTLVKDKDEIIERLINDQLYLFKESKEFEDNEKRQLVSELENLNEKNQMLQSKLEASNDAELMLIKENSSLRQENERLKGRLRNISQYDLF